MHPPGAFGYHRSEHHYIGSEHFWMENAGGIERKFMLADYLGHGDDVIIICDASEHGCN